MCPVLLVLGMSSWVLQCFSSFLPPDLLFHSGLSSSQPTFPPLQPFILQMLAWLCGLSFQHKGRSVDEGLASAWAPASVICPRQPLAEPRGGWAWAGHGAWGGGPGGLRTGAMGRERTHSCVGRVNLPPFTSTSLHVIQHTTSSSHKETRSLSQCSSSECCLRTFPPLATLHNVQRPLWRGTARVEAIYGRLCQTI